MFCLTNKTKIPAQKLCSVFLSTAMISAEKENNALLFSYICNWNSQRIYKKHSHTFAERAAPLSVKKRHQVKNILKDNPKGHIKKWRLQISQSCND